MREQGYINLYVFARRHDEANTAAEREIAAPRKIPDLRLGTEDIGVRPVRKREKTPAINARLAQ